MFSLTANHVFRPLRSCVGGEFCASPRVSTFLSTVSRYHASVRHVSGSAILPSDFASRNALPCEYLACQVCNVVNRIEESVVLRTSTQDILAGASRLPFTSRTSWLAIQSECSDLRRTRAHLHQGTRPSTKLTNIRDVKRYHYRKRWLSRCLPK